MARRKLASAAAHLNARSPHAGRAPMLVLMTDDDRLPDPVAAARQLPKGAMIVVRARDGARRNKLADELVALAHNRGLIVLIANDAGLAARCGADGLHLSQANAHQAAHWRALRPHWFISVAAHDERAATLSKFVDAIFLSPVFPTRSHPGAPALTPVRANHIAQAVALPVYALGGVTARNAALLNGFAGIAAIGALAV
ncbi:MAG: thiamine phosphate synthase [Rhizomicrobium sp.]